MRWRNGQGATVEIAAVPSRDDWIWRLSVAEVVDDGPFSTFAGVDRALAVVSGAGMILRIAGERIDVRRYETVNFDGGMSTVCSLIDGPVRDLNLMVRRDRSIGEPVLEVSHLSAGTPVALGSAIAAVVLDGVVTLTTTSEVFPFTPLVQQATRFDALLPTEEGEPPALGVVRRDAVVVFARLNPTK